ncbi:hypothetical protein V6N13_040844 [Hibiscus sabdariffa]
MREAETLVIMFGGAWVVDRRIQVNIAKYSCRSSYWRKKHPQDVSRAAVHQNVRTIFNGPVDKIVEKGGCSFAGTVENKLITNLNPDDKAGIDSDVETEPFSKKHKALYEEVQGTRIKRKEVASRRIQGHVEEESLWKLSRCLIGTMATDCNTEEVKRRLHNWGLGDLVIKSMGGRRFLIDLNDDELLRLMEEQQWSLLKEVFLEVCYWSEDFKVPVRTTWVEVVGMPLHCWNYMTFKRIAECWGSLVALGENINQSQGCEKMSLLIQTNQLKKIEDIIGIEVGNEVYEARIYELYIIKVSTSSLKSCLGEKDDRKIVSETGESSSESTTMSAQIEKTVSSGDNPIGIDEALNVVCMGKSFHDYESTQNKDKSRSLGEPDLVGCRPEAHSVDSVSTHSSNSVLGDDLVRNKSKNIPNKDVGPKWVDVVNGIEKSMLPTDPNVNNPCYQQALEDSNSIGCQENEPVNIVNVDKVTGREECENPIQKSLVQKEKAQEQMGGILPASKVIKAVEWAKLSERNLPDLGHRDEERGTLVLPELQQKTNPVESSGFIAGESVELCGRKLTFMDHQEVESCSFDLPEFQQKSKPARVKRREHLSCTIVTAFWLCFLSFWFVRDFEICIW